MYLHTHVYMYEILTSLTLVNILWIYCTVFKRLGSFFYDINVLSVASLVKAVTVRRWGINSLKLYLRISDGGKVFPA